MKTIVTLTDLPDGGVNVHIMTQLTTPEIDAGVNPEHSNSYRLAQSFSAIAVNAKTLAEEMRAMQAEMAEQAQGAARCWH